MTDKIEEPIKSISITVETESYTYTGVFEDPLELEKLRGLINEVLKVIHANEKTE